MPDKKPERRDFLFTASYAVGAVGAVHVYAAVGAVVVYRLWGYRNDVFRASRDSGVEHSFSVFRVCECRCMQT